MEKYVKCAGICPMCEHISYVRAYVKCAGISLVSVVPLSMVQGWIDKVAG